MRSFKRAGAFKKALKYDRLDLLTPLRAEAALLTRGLIGEMKVT